ncbi:sterol carrier family protein [Streptomyces sp. NPDC092296]|uniref:sterol carrier family protein n=1 Tax=Streptomyces sp. NPDC092296 TaxID=3366012 RepID=UPI003829A6DD
MPPSSARKNARRTRSYDPGRVRTALVAQIEALREAVHSLCAHPQADALLSAPTRRGDRAVWDLVAQLASELAAVPAQLQEPVPEGDPGTPTAWALAGRAAEEKGTEAARPEAVVAPGDLASAFDRAADALLALLAGPEAAEPGRRIAVSFGPMLFTDYLVTRLLETVVRADDLAEAVGRAARAQAVDSPMAAPEAFRHDRQALAAATRLLADTMAEAVPGGAVELRVPPYAVVQCVAGPRHTRGTPPNVVETDPLTWLRLATGRVAWADAVEDAAVSASGERSDLSGYLPVLG